MPTTNSTNPSYSPTDIGTALVTVIFAVLDVLTGYGVIPAISPQMREPLIISLTVLTVAGIGLYGANRAVKHVELTKIEVARVASVAAAAAPSPAPSNSIPYQPAPTLPAPFQIPEEPPPTT